MNILYITHALNGLLMIGIPIGLGIYLTRRFQLNWRLWWIGGATFILSQVGHLPFNSLLNNLFLKGILPIPPEAYRLVVFSIIGGLSAGLWEEFARYFVYRWWIRDARRWKQGVLFGAGHGSMEAIILGVLVFYTYLQMAALKNADLATVISPDQLDAVQKGLQQYWSVSWPLSLLGAVERAFSIPFHIACAVLVLQVFTRKQTRWLWIAIAWHAFSDAAISGYAAQKLSAYSWGAYAIEGLVGLTLLINIPVILALRDRDQPSEGIEAPPPSSPAEIMLPPPDIEETPENLDKTRYLS